MIQRLLPVLVLALTLAGCQSDSSPNPADAPKSNVAAAEKSGPGAQQIEDPQPVADVTLTTLDGASIDLREQDGKVVLLNFWATWCGPCIKEIPDLNELHADLHDEGLTVVGIANQQGRAEVEPFMKKHPMDYPVVTDSTGAINRELGPVYVLPTTLVVGPDGTVRYKVPGVFPVDDLRDELEAMLEEG
jgi:cytochrome c biogenesis protein CcmG/thiol:disulfide interchange protein DsbE